MARSVLFMLALGWILAFAGTAAAADKDADLKALIQKAIKAHGGEEKLDKFKAGTMKAKGKIEIMGASLDFTQDVAFMMPDKFRQTLELVVGDKRVSIVAVANGKDIWITADGKEVPVTDDVKNELKDASLLTKVMRLVPLKDKEFELSALGEVKVEGKPAVGIKAAAKGGKDVSLYFDKETHLLVKVLWRVHDAASGQDVEEERIITEYGKSEGIPVAKKILVNRDGKKFIEAEITETKLLEKLDDNQFAKP